MLTTFIRMIITGLMLLSLFSPTSTAKRPTAAAKCKPYKIPVEVDSNHDYTPYYVDLHRCKGQCSQASPHNCECVPATQQDVKVYIINPTVFKVKILQNHTSCQNKCKESFKSVCKSGGHLWNEAACTCSCRNAPSGQTCNAKQRWDSGKCQCVCSKSKSQGCSQGMTWNSSSCGCQCSMSTFTQCSTIGRVTNLVTCRCETQAPVVGQVASKRLNGNETKLVAALVVIGLLLGTLFIIDLVLMCSKKGFMYGVVTKCSENKDPTTITREETDTGSVMLESDNNTQETKRNGNCNHKHQSLTSESETDV